MSYLVVQFSPAFVEANDDSWHVFNPGNSKHGKQIDAAFFNWVNQPTATFVFRLEIAVPLNVPPGAATTPSPLLRHWSVRYLFMLILMFIIAFVRLTFILTQIAVQVRWRYGCLTVTLRAMRWLMISVYRGEKLWYIVNNIIHRVTCLMSRQQMNTKRLQTISHLIKVNYTIYILQFLIMY